MITGDDFRVFMELSDEWEKVFNQPLHLDPMIGPEQFPMLRECLRLKSQKPWNDYIDEEMKASRIY